MIPLPPLTGAPDPARALRASFEAAVSPPAAFESLGSELDDALDQALAEARRCWPTIDLAPEIFAAHLATRLDPGKPPLAALRALPAADLYLACACARFDVRAIAAFEARYAADLDDALARLGASPFVADDVKSRLREKMFCPTPPHPSLLVHYGGRSRLGPWLRSIAVRDYFKVAPAKQRHDASEIDELDAAVSGGDPELSYLKESVAAEFKSALATALTTLSVRERNLLRQHFLDALTVEQLGQTYGVHRATAARWVAQARGKLLREVRRRLMAHLRLSERELESMMRLVQSNLDLSIARILRHDPP